MSVLFSDSQALSGPTSHKTTVFPASSSSTTDISTITASTSPASTIVSATSSSSTITTTSYITAPSSPAFNATASTTANSTRMNSANPVQALKAAPTRDKLLFIDGHTFKNKRELENYQELLRIIKEYNNAYQKLKEILGHLDGIQNLNGNPLHLSPLRPLNKLRKQRPLVEKDEVKQEKRVPPFPPNLNKPRDNEPKKNKVPIFKKNEMCSKTPISLESSRSHSGISTTEKYSNGNLEITPLIAPSRRDVRDQMAQNPHDQLILSDLRYDYKEVCQKLSMLQDRLDKLNNFNGPPSSVMKIHEIRDRAYELKRQIENNKAEQKKITLASSSSLTQSHDSKSNTNSVPTIKTYARNSETSNYEIYSSNHTALTRASRSQKEPPSLGEVSPLIQPLIYRSTTNRERTPNVRYLRSTPPITSPVTAKHSKLEKPNSRSLMYLLSGTKPLDHKTDLRIATPLVVKSSPTDYTNRRLLPPDYTNRRLPPTYFSSARSQATSSRYQETSSRSQATSSRYQETFTDRNYF